MADFRPGDIATVLGPLRLSVGALAEIAMRLNAPGPATLAARLRTLDDAAARHLLISLLRTPTAEAQVARLNNTELAEITPLMTRCLEEALR